MLAKLNGLFRLTRDMELKYAASGTAVGNLGLACSEKYKDKETQLFLDAVIFGKAAEIVNQYAGSKRTQIYLSGKLKTEQWQDKNTGQNRSKVVFEIQDFDFVSGQSSQQSQDQPQQQNHQQSMQAQQPPQYAPNGFEDDDVPFSMKATSPELFMLV